VIEYDLNPESSQTHGALYFVGDEVFVGPAQYQFPEPEDYFIEGPAGLRWRYQPEQPEFYQIIHDRFRRLLRAWALR